MRGHGDDRGVPGSAFAIANGSRGLESVHFRHLTVHQHQRVDAPGNHRQRLVAGGVEWRVTPFAEVGVVRGVGDEVLAAVPPVQELRRGRVDREPKPEVGCGGRSRVGDAEEEARWSPQIRR